MYSVYYYIKHNQYNYNQLFMSFTLEIKIDRTAFVCKSPVIYKKLADLLQSQKDGNSMKL